MSVYKDNKTGKWYAIFRYKDWSGKTIQKKKSGFNLRREALEYERNYIEQQSNSPSITFSNLYTIYYNHKKDVLKPSSMLRKDSAVKSHILPYFADFPINKITSNDVRKWQNEVKANNNFATQYLKSLHSELSAILNFAIKYYGLTVNPAKQCGNMGKTQNTIEIKFWTKFDFDKFIACVDDSTFYFLFNLLFYTGIRIGEALALTGEDFNLEDNTLSITKTCNRINGVDIIDKPKTVNSIRTVTLPNCIIKIFKDYIATIYDYKPSMRFFIFDKQYVRYYFAKYIDKAAIEQIRVHDLRHSHASLLIDLEFQPLIISERLGHKDIKTTLNTYGHLYPNKQSEVANKLDEIYYNT